MDSSLNKYENCISHVPKINDFLQPSSVDELRGIVREANAKSQTISVFSRGNNWGYGAKAPTVDNSIVISLEQMNRIKSFDSKSGIVRLEPGVSFKDLSDFLIAQGDEWLCPVHGGGPNTSVLGNVLERGFGITPIEDHFQSLMSLHAILPTGEEYSSSFSSMDLDLLDEHFHWGIGPYMDGLFTQSNFGIVTEICICLAPKKESVGVVLSGLRPEIGLDQIVPIIQKIQKDFSGNVGGINLMNKERMISMATDYPEDKKRTGEVLANTELNTMAEEFKVQDWNILLSVYGNKKVTKLIAKEIKTALKPMTKRLVFMDQFNLSFLKKLSKYIPRIGKFNLRKLVGKLNSLFSILNGVPNDTALNLAYWLNEKTPNDKSLRPDHDNCGLIWYSPIIPMGSAIMEDFIENSNEISKKHNFNCLLTFTSFNHQCFECTFPILYNKDIEGAAEKAKEFYFELLRENRKLGCYPYRLPIFAMDELTEFKSTPSFKLARAIKNIVDPNEILSPNRYVVQKAAGGGRNVSNQL